MELNLRSSYRYAIACPTSMGVRITPDNRMAVHNSNHFYMQATSAESNVLNVASSLGNECLVLTKFVKGIPMPAFSSALSYFDGYTTAALPANLLQAQRDYFGAHTYERIDQPRGQFFHTNWTGHGGNTSAFTYNA